MIETGNRVVIVRPARVENAYGDVTYSHGPDATREPFEGSVSAMPGASQETWGDRDLTSVQYTVALQPQVRLGSRDAVELDGTLYAIEGKPLQVPSPTGALAHTLVALKEWE